MSKLSDKAQLGQGKEPTYELRASNPCSGMVLRFMGNAYVALGLTLKERAEIIEIAAAMDAWRARNSAGG